MHTGQISKDANEQKPKTFFMPILQPLKSLIP